MLQSDSDTGTLWARLPVAEPPTRLRAAVLEDLRRSPSGRSGRVAGGLAGFAVAALFVLAVALPMRMTPTAVADPALALLRAQGLDVDAPPTAAMPAEVRRVASGSTAERLGLRAGDRLLSIVPPLSEGGMVNLAVLRDDSPEYFALPAIAHEAAGPGAGMAGAAPRERRPAPAVVLATVTPGITSFLQSFA